MVATAMVNEPDILLLDEPVGGLTPPEIEEFIELMLRLKGQGLTLIFIEHDMSIVFKIAQSIKVLSYGAVLAEGTPEEIRRHPEVIKAYLGDEFEDGHA